MSNRNDKRLSEEILVHATAVFDEECKMTRYEQPKELTIVDLSASGVLIRTDMNLEKGHSINIYFSLEEKEIEMMITIVRKCDEFEDKENNYYGCKFELLNSKTEQIIRRYIYTKEISKRRQSGNSK